MATVQGFKGIAVGLAVGALALGMAAQAARADTITTDPPLLFISGSPTSFCQSTTDSGTDGSGNNCLLPSKEVNEIDSTAVYIDFNGGSNHQVTSPILLILGIPIGPTGSNFPNPSSAPSITGASSSSGSVGFSNPGDFSTSYYGVSLGQPNSFSSGDAYDAVNLSGAGGNSQNLGNWQTATYYLDCVKNSTSYCGSDAAATTDHYDLYVYTVNPNFTFSGGQSIGVTFDNEPVDGSMLVAFSCASGYSTDLTKACATKDTYATPFTQAGVFWPGNEVPEPMSLALFGTGLLGLGLVRRRKRAA